MLRAKHTIIFTAIALLAFYSTNTQCADEPLFRSLSSKEEGIVDEVLTADTIRLKNKKIIKLIGLKAPEAPPKRKSERDEFGFIIEEKDPTKTTEERAFDFTQKLLNQKEVLIEYDVQRRNDSFDLVAYVFLKDDTFANAEILRQGFAMLSIRVPNTKYEEILRDAYKEARKEKRGLHSF